MINLKRKNTLTIKLFGLFLVFLISILFTGCSFNYVKPSTDPIEIPQWKKDLVITNENYFSYQDEYDIICNTDGLIEEADKYYVKHLDYKASNGKKIRIVAQDEVKDEQLLYAYAILDFYLRNLPQEVLDFIVEGEEKYIVLPNGSDGDGATSEEAMIGQNLNQEEISNVGSKWYIENDYEHRDASFEEIFHFVHDYGIGTTQNPGAFPSLAKSIGEAQVHALPENKSDWGKKGLWGLNSAKWLKELEKEGSLEQEYIVSVIDSYYGLWEAFDEEGGMWGTYCAKNREEVMEKDSMGYEVLSSFLPEYIDSMMRIEDTFQGTFYMNYQENLTYTSKSKYLTTVSLTGNKNTNIIGNDQDNLFMGNSGFNEINGVSGNNILQLRGVSKDYSIENTLDGIKITDSIENRDGIILIKNIQTLRFADLDIVYEK